MTCSLRTSASFLQLIAEGKSNKYVANMFNLSLYTVRKGVIA